VTCHLTDHECCEVHQCIPDPCPSCERDEARAETERLMFVATKLSLAIAMMDCDHAAAPCTACDRREAAQASFRDLVNKIDHAVAAPSSAPAPSPPADNRPLTGAPASPQVAGGDLIAAPDWDRLVQRFLAWPLPVSVCADLVATRHGETGRTGTNLLSATEAEEMLRHVLAAAKGEQ
jgi:hypothetical protein